MLDKFFQKIAEIRKSRNQILTSITMFSDKINQKHFKHLICQKSVQKLYSKNRLKNLSKNLSKIVKKFNFCYL